MSLLLDLVMIFIIYVSLLLSWPVNHAILDMRVFLMRHTLVCGKLISLGVSIELFVICWLPSRYWCGMNFLDYHIVDTRSRFLFLVLSFQTYWNASFDVWWNPLVADSRSVRPWAWHIRCKLRQKWWRAVIIWLDGVKLRWGIQLLNSRRNFRLSWNRYRGRNVVSPWPLVSAYLKALGENTLKSHA